MPSWWSSKTKNKLTPEYLAGLCQTIIRYYENTASVKQDVVVETVRQLAEVIVWGDAQEEGKIFDTFLERNMLPYLTELLCKDVPAEVKIQLIQTLYILIQNLKNPVAVFYLLSGNYINNLIMNDGLDLETDDELLSNFINFLKSLSLRLDTGTIQCFYNRDTDTFPLYVAAKKFLSHHEALVRTASRAIVVHMCKVDDPYVVNYVVNTAEYLKTVFTIFTEQAKALHKHSESFYSAMNGGPPPSVAISTLGGLVDDIVDDLFYFGDLLQLRNQPLLYSLYTNTAQFTQLLHASVTGHPTPLPPYIAQLITALWVVSTTDPAFQAYTIPSLCGHTPKCKIKKPAPLPPVQQKHFDTTDAADDAAGSHASTPREAQAVREEAQNAPQQEPTINEEVQEAPQEALPHEEAHGAPPCEVPHEAPQTHEEQEVAQPQEETSEVAPCEAPQQHEEAEPPQPHEEVKEVTDEVQADAEDGTGDETKPAEEGKEGEVREVTDEVQANAEDGAGDEAKPAEEGKEGEAHAADAADEGEQVATEENAEEEVAEEEEDMPLPESDGKWLLRCLQWDETDGMRCNVTGINLVYSFLEGRLPDDILQATGVAPRSVRKCADGTRPVFQEHLKNRVAMIEGALNEVPAFLTGDAEFDEIPDMEEEAADEYQYPYHVVGGILRWLCNAVRNLGACGRLETFEVAFRAVEVMVKGGGLSGYHERLLRDVYRSVFMLVKRRLKVMEKEIEEKLNGGNDVRPLAAPPPSLMGGPGAPAARALSPSAQQHTPTPPPESRMIFDPLETLFFHFASLTPLYAEITQARPKQVLQRPSILLPLLRPALPEPPESPVGSVAESMPASPSPMVKSAEPGTYMVIGKSGAMVRQEESLESKLLVRLKQSCIVEIVEVRQRRCKISAPVEGWISMWNSVGETILQRMSPEPVKEDGPPGYLSKIPLEQRNPCDDGESAQVECLLFLLARRCVDSLAGRRSSELVNDVLNVSADGKHLPRLGMSLPKDTFAAHVRCQLCPQPSTTKATAYSTPEFNNTHIGTVLFACLEDTELVLLQDLPPHMQQPNMATIVAVCPLFNTLVHVDVRLNYRMSIKCKSFMCTLTFENAATCQQTASKVNAIAKQLRTEKTRAMCNALNDPCLEL
eukprot:TRINITY_DN845_c0_g1_i1.p1 TRINITY_DN845_c0_g1~~TRINITY_DN845_c0_g1_i1.p1  ORF type:complete len:1138 (+),score=349.31 TRINITY_DN845_c0_g1_i1:124-3537(+)